MTETYRRLESINRKLSKFSENHYDPWDDISATLNGKFDLKNIKEYNECVALLANLKIAHTQHKYMSSHTALFGGLCLTLKLLIKSWERKQRPICTSLLFSINKPLIKLHL